MTCKLCGHATRTIHQHSFNIDFHYCNHCEFLFKDPKDYITKAAEKEIYDRHENDINDPNYQAFFEAFIEPSLLPFVKKDAIGLDFGSGPAPVLAQLLKHKYGFTMDIYDLFYHNLPLERAHYDFITCTEVIEHIDDPDGLMARFHELLVTGGILSVMTMFHRKDDAFFQNWHYMRDMSHISFFTEKTMVYLAHKHSFEIVYCDQKRYTTFRKL